MSEIGKTFLDGIEKLKPRLSVHVEQNGIMAQQEFQQELVDYVTEKEQALIKALGISERQLHEVAKIWLEESMESIKLGLTGEGYA